MTSVKAVAGTGISYSFLRTLKATELTALIESGFAAFDLPISQGFVAPKINRSVDLYRIFYTIDINHSQFTEPQPQVLSGLLMIPGLLAEDTQEERTLPLAIYNHGTLFNRQLPPSKVVFEEDQEWAIGSYETLINIGLFANNGYAMIASDYVGCGNNFYSLHEAYGVKEPTSEAIIGLLEASRKLLPMLGVNPAQLFLNGWSQGGMNTQWAVQQLETLQIPVTTAAVSSPFNELQETAKWWLSQVSNNPVSPAEPAPWLSLCVGILISSYESWYDLNGLFNALIKDEVIPNGKDSEGNVIRNDAKVTYREILNRFAQYGDRAVKFDSSFSNYSWAVNIIRDGFKFETTIPGFTPADMLINGALETEIGIQFLQKLESISPRYWAYRTPLKSWYGLSDEALPPDLVAPGMKYKGDPLVTLVPVNGASHRQTFLNSLLASPLQPKGGTDQNLIDWFASFRKASPALPSLVASSDHLIVRSEDFGVLAVLLNVEQQQGERAMHLQIVRTRQDGRSELIGTLGGTTASANQLQSLGSARVLLQVGDQLRFKLLSTNGNTFDNFAIAIQQKEQDTGFNVNIKNTGTSQVGSLQFSILPQPNIFTSIDFVAAPQSEVNNGLLQLSQGQKLNLEITTDCAFINRLGFVQLNKDPVTGLVVNTVGTENIAISSTQFRDKIDTLLDPGFQISTGGRQILSSLDWIVGQDGIYAPVLITPQGNVFCGAAGAIGSEQMRMLGQNTIGFEDLIGHHSDYDWNDVVFVIKSIG